MFAIIYNNNKKDNGIESLPQMCHFQGLGKNQEYQYLRSTGIHAINIKMGKHLSPAHLVYTLESCLILFISGIHYTVHQQEL